jgi:hypothetical protein
MASRSARSYVPRIPLDPRDEVFAAFLRMAAQTHPGQPLVDVVREALAAWLVGDPASSALVSAREGAWRGEARRARELLGLALQQAHLAYRQQSGE